jgi:pimeloyl-ACP methyl ester carboxylesterase
MRLKINGTTLNVFEAGVENYNKTRPSLVFLHYFGGSSRAWTEVVAELAADYHWSRRICAVSARQILCRKITRLKIMQTMLPI